MNKLSFYLLIFFAFFPPVALAKDAYLSMAYSSALQDELPFSIYSKGSWSPDPNARFVKLHLYFDEPVSVKRVEIHPCQSLASPISVFVNFDEITSAGFSQSYQTKTEGDLLILEEFEGKVFVIRSLTFNFERNEKFRICGIDLKDPIGGSYQVKTPLLISGKVDASSVLDPKSAYDPIYLFDSRFEYGWSSNKQAKNVSLNFIFDEPKRVEKLRIWNGYQRSTHHYNANSRPTKLKITGDGNYSAVVLVKNMLGSQEVLLPKPFEGKQIKIEVIDAIIGKDYKDLVISELRFYDGNNWFLLDPTATLKKNIASNKEAFLKGKVDFLLNNSYTAEISNGDEEYREVSISSILRLRSDGSLYLTGFLGEKGSDYFALGNYEIKEILPSGGIKLRIFGLYYETKVYGDCNGCGRDCNKNEILDENPNQKIFQEFLTITPAKDGTVEIVNSGGGKKLNFNNLSFKKQA